MPSQVHGNPDHRKLRSPPSVPEFARLFAGGESIRTFSSAMPRHRQQRGRLQGEWRLLEPPKQLYRFAEADDRSGDSPAPTVDRGKRVGPLDQHPDRPRSAPSRGSRRSGPSCSIRQSTTQSRGSRWNVGTALQLIRSIVEVTRGILGSSRPSSTPIFALIRALPRRVAQGRRVRLIGDRAEGALSLPARILRGPRRPVAADHIPALPPFGRLPRAISARKCASARISCNPIIVLPRARLH